MGDVDVLVVLAVAGFFSEVWCCSMFVLFRLILCCSTVHCVVVPDGLTTVAQFG